MRKDAFGFFWEDKAPEKVKGVRTPAGPRPLPEIPDTGWISRDLPRLDKAKLIGLDTETKDMDLLEKGPGVRRGAHIIGMSVATEDNHSWYFPIRHEMGDNLDPDNVMRWAKDNLTNPKQPKVGTNLVYDLDFLFEAGVEVAGPFYDIQVAEALIDEEANGYSLDAIANRHLKTGKVSSDLEDWIYRAYGNKNYRAELYRSPSQLVGPYAEADASLPIQIHLLQQKILRNEKLLPIWGIECAQIPLLLAMRRRGVKVDLKKAGQIEARLERLIEEDTKEIRKVAGFDIDIDTKGHLIKLFDNLGLEYPKTAKGNPSFAKDFLEHHPHPVAQKIVALRKWEKFLSTFIRGYILDLNVNGRIHCQFNQLHGDDYGARSGRYSSSLPNLQNTPARDKIWGPLIRSIFIPEEGEDWAKLDWSQIEYRILTHRGKGPSAVAARKKYRDDPTTDYHQMVSDMTGVERGPAKNLNFGLVYGMGKEELARQLGMTVEEALPLFNKYHERMPFVKEIHQDTMARASLEGYIVTLLGRRRRFNMFEPKYRTAGDYRNLGLPWREACEKYGHRVRRAYTHKALNADIQGSAADLMKKAMQDYAESEMIKVLGAPLLTVHDELDFSVPRTKVGMEALTETKRIMETCIKISVPVIADLEMGPNWGEVK